MKRKLLVIGLLLYSVSIYAQDSGPDKAPDVKTFSSQPDLLGQPTNSVNLFSGQVSLPVNLISIAGRGGLDVNVAIQYNSNVRSTINTWNLEAPASILGLGWSLNIPKIIVDHKQTGTREDDDYYLVENGISNPLIRTNSGNDTDGNFYTYTLKNYQFWKIKYYYDNIEVTGSGVTATSGVNKWEITKEDGTRYIYGDKNSGRGTLQFAVRWQNWIGNSAQVFNQSQLAIAWNLSEIVNLWGDRITFSYSNVEQCVGSLLGQKHTEASYLTQITDVIGRKVSFIYTDKQPQYYQEPHTEMATEPDAYQEVYEKKYLDHIDVLETSGSKLMSVNFAYGSVNNGTAFAKMLLTSIQQVSSISTTLPKMTFNYYTDGDAKGFLQSLTYPTGGTIAYTYSKKVINSSRRELQIYAPYGYAEAKTWMGEDYIVVSWRSLGNNNTHDGNGKDVIVKVYQWAGQWIEKSLGSMGDVAAYVADNSISDYKYFQIVTENNFFAIARKGVDNTYKLSIYSKDVNLTGEWNQYTINYDVGDGDPALLSGTNFVALAPLNNKPLALYTFTGDGWSPSTITQNVADHYYTACNNFIISQKIGVPDLPPNFLPEFNFYYLTSDKKWVTRTLPSNLIYYSTDKGYWYSSNGMAVAMAPNDNPEFAYRWDVGYNNFFKDTKDVNNNDLFGKLPDDAPVFIMNNSLIGADKKLVRYDGLNWYGASLDADPYYNSYGNDIVVGQNGMRKSFNPNTLQWESTITPSGSDAGFAYSSVGIDFFFSGNGYYYRQTDGSWLKKNVFVYDADDRRWSKSGYPRFDVWFFWKRRTMEIDFFKNGELSSYIVPDFTTVGKGAIPCQVEGDQMLIGFSSNGNNYFDKTLATSLKLFKVSNEKIQGVHDALAVTLLTVVNGGKTQYTTIDYNLTNAEVDPSGQVARYYEVKIIPGSNSIKNQPYGYTKMFFKNGVYPIQIGLPTQSSIYAADNTLISSTQTQYTTFSHDISNNVGTKVEFGIYVRPTSINSSVDGITTTTTNTYDVNTGLIKQSLVTGPVIIETDYKYFWEAYDPAMTLNILTPVASVKQKKNNQDMQATATRYKKWTSANNSSGVYAPYDNYNWRGTLSSDFVVWDITATPTSNWQFLGKVSAVDSNTGIPLETINDVNQTQCMVLNGTSQKVIAQVTNASLSDIGYASFEADNGSVISIRDGSVTSGVSKMGSNYLVLGTQGILKQGLNPNQAYKVSCWIKTAANTSISITGQGTVSLGVLSDWTLYEYAVTGVSSIAIQAISNQPEVDIDEVRIYPVNAFMSTFSYHPVYGVVSQADVNNQVLYTEYDPWGRVQTVKDENRNVVKSFFYNFKN